MHTHITKRAVMLALVASVAGFQVAGCASGPNQRSTGQVVDDSTLTARVKSAIAADASVGTAAKVNVTTNRGVVQLAGFLDSQQEIQRVASIARGVDGVRSIQNDLHVNPPSGTSSR